MKEPGNNRWAIVHKMFFDNFLVAVFIELSYVGAVLIDGIFVSRALTSADMAAFGVAQPVFSFLAIFYGLFATGMQTITSQELGSGNVRDCNRIFCAAFYISGIFSIFISGVMFFFSGHLAVFLGGAGSDPYLLEKAAEYIRGIAIGTPALFLEAVIAPAIQMDSGKNRILVSLPVAFVCDVLFDVIAVRIGLGIFGIGLYDFSGRICPDSDPALPFQGKK